MRDMNEFEIRVNDRNSLSFPSQAHAESAFAGMVEEIGPDRILAVNSGSRNNRHGRCQFLSVYFLTADGGLGMIEHTVLTDIPIAVGPCRYDKAAWKDHVQHVKELASPRPAAMDDDDVMADLDIDDALMCRD
jgi:hypothetical protein